MTRPGPRPGVVLGTAAAVGRYRLTGRTRPLSATLAPTNRCQGTCSYCDIPRARALPERPVAWWIALVGELSRRGCRRVGFTGGEPLLYSGLHRVAAQARRLGMLVSCGTNGLLVPERPEVLDQLDYLVVSVDGPDSDRTRFPGSLAGALRAIEVARGRGLPVWGTAVLTRDSVDDIEALLDWADALDLRLNLQLPFHPVDYSGQDNADAFPTDAQITRLLAVVRPRSGPTGRVLNSLAYWDHVQRWAHVGARVVEDAGGRSHACLGGKLIVHVEPDGRVYPCTHRVGGFDALDADALDAALARARAPGCETCLSAYAQEQSLLFSLDPRAVVGWVGGMVRAFAADHARR